MTNAERNKQAHEFQKVGDIEKAIELYELNIQLIEDTIRNNYVDLLMSKPATSDTPQQIGKLEKIRNLRYMYNNVEYNEDTNKYHLVQNNHPILS